MQRIQMDTDPFNIIFAGVGGQGNVLASRILSNMLFQKGYIITIGETFGATQRGGYVMSHIRISAKCGWSPQIPSGGAHVIIAIEPVEALRVLTNFGNRGVKVLVNTRPIYPVGVISGELNYPSIDVVQSIVNELSSRAWFIKATDLAMEIGNPILGNIIMIGALSKLGILPLEREEFKNAVLKILPESKLEINLKAFDIGTEMLI